MQNLKRLRLLASNYALNFVFQADHEAGVISPREFHRRLAFCTRKLNEARRCLNDGFSPLDPPTDKPDKPVKPVKPDQPEESASRRLERRAKQKIWHFVLCRSQLMDPNRVRFESFVEKEEEDWKNSSRKFREVGDGLTKIRVSPGN